MTSFKPTGFNLVMYVRARFGTGRPNFSREFLKENKLLALRICNSSLFHYEIAYEKK